MNNTNTMYRTNREANQISETMTAREMALTSHKLNRDGMVAKTSDGRKFAWVGTEWARFQ